MVKKILIPYATYGNGHKMVAMYLEKNFKKKNPDLIVETLDILDYATPFMRKVSKGIFEKTMFAKNPILWDFIYRFYNHKWRSLGMKSLCYHIFDKEKLRQKMQEFNPDVIISTHFFASMLVSRYKRHDLINSKLYTIITDYDLHEAWLKANEVEEALIVGNKEMKKELIKKGIDKNKIKVFGIPISDEFSFQNNPQVAKEKLKLDNKITILFFGGGNNSNVSLPFFKAIVNYANFNIIFIAGKNNELKKKVQKIVTKTKAKNVKVYGFVDNVIDFMAASDVVVTKPGGLTVTECLFLQKPMILINKSAGQEKGNYKYLVNKKYALKAEHPKQIVKFLKTIETNPEILKRMSNNMKDENKKKAIDDIYNLIMK